MYKSFIMVHYQMNLHYLQIVEFLDITAGGDFLGLCDQKSSYKHVSDF